MSVASDNVMVLIVDDHPVYLDGISFILQSVYENAEVLRAHSAREAVATVEQFHNLDWIFIDYNLPDNDGISVLKQFRNLMVTTPVIMMSGTDDIGMVAEAIDLGAGGFIHKACGRAAYQECLTTIEAGGTYLSPELRTLLEHYRKNMQQAKSRLREQICGRRLEVLVLISKGYSNAELAAALNISEATAKTHVSALLSILEADNRSHCVAEARAHGLLK